MPSPELAVVENIHPGLSEVRHPTRRSTEPSHWFSDAVPLAQRYDRTTIIGSVCPIHSLKASNIPTPASPEIPHSFVPGLTEEVMYIKDALFLSLMRNLVFSSSLLEVNILQLHIFAYFINAHLTQEPWRALASTTSSKTAIMFIAKADWSLTINLASTTKRAAGGSLPCPSISTRTSRPSKCRTMP